MKVDAEKYRRIIELKKKYNLTHSVIGERLGISASTVKVYLRMARREEAEIDVSRQSNVDPPL